MAIVDPAGSMWPNQNVQACVSLMRPKFGSSAAAPAASPASALLRASCSIEWSKPDRPRPAWSTT